MRTSVIRRFARAAALAAGMIAPLYSTAAWAQAHTIRLVVPFPAGGPTDMLARVLGEQIGRAQSATIVIENRPGAEGVIGTEAVSRATRDGNTLLITPSNFVVNAQLRSTNYNPLTSFEPICHLVNSPEVVAVNSGSPYRTLADLIAVARAKPGDLTLAGGGATSRVIFEMLKRATGVNITYVPYPGGAPALTALLGGHVTSQLADYAPLAEQLKNGSVRALATPSTTRIAQLLDVPTVAESGYTDIKVDSWYGLLAPTGTAKETISRVAGWFAGALQKPDVAAKLVTLGLYPTAICGTEFAAHLRDEYDRYGRIVREANVKAE